MSAHQPDTGHSGDDDHDHAVFDATPATVLGADEPPSPMWLPVLGTVLFIAMALVWTLSGETDAEAKDGAKDGAPAVSITTAAVKPAADRAAAAKAKAPTLRPLPKLKRLATPPARGAAQPGAARPGAGGPAAGGPLPGVGKAPTRADLQRMIQRQREAGGLRPPASKKPPANKPPANPR